MNRIQVKFIGMPKVLLNDREIYMPFAKASGLLYYVLYEKSALREHLCDLFWGGLDEKNAKKNLRNAVYSVRKAAYEGIIVSPKRAVLKIDPDCELVSDVDWLRDFPEEKEPDAQSLETFLSAYDGDFLEGIGGGEAPAYEEWVRACAQDCRRDYVEKLKKLFHRFIRDKKYMPAEKCGKKLIGLEEFEEVLYRSLMFVYKEQGKFGECIEVYNRLEKTLRQNLSIRPSEETRRFFETIIKNQTHEGAGGAPKAPIYGREREMRLLRENLIRFLSGEEFCSYMIVGEAGIGKTCLIDSFRGERGAIVLKAACYEVEMDFLFKLWDRLFKQVSFIIREKGIKIPPELAGYITKMFPTLDLGAQMQGYSVGAVGDSGMAEKAVFDLFAIISKRERIVLLIDDLHWADKSSRELLCKVIFANRERIMLLATCRDEYQSGIHKLYYNLNHNGCMDQIVLTRFTPEETKGLVSLMMPAAEAQSGKIHEQSEGNPLFITEIINGMKAGLSETVMTDKMAVLIGGRVLALTGQAQKLLSICAVFYDSFHVKILSRVMDMSSVELMERLEELLEKNMLCEERLQDGGVELKFTHVKIRDYVYHNISASKRILLHERIGEYYESKLRKNRRDRIYYSKLIYHFTRSTNGYKQFKYEIKRLQVILDVSHEIFPRHTLDDRGVMEYYTDEAELERLFEQLTLLYGQLRHEDAGDMRELELIYLLLYGRFHKDRGTPQKGYDAILRLIEQAKCAHNRQFEFEGYVQLIQYAININDLAIMEQAIVCAEQAANPDDVNESALAQRYRGYLYVLQGNCHDGQGLLELALQRFEAAGNPEKYQMNVAACYFYLGEGLRLQKQYEEALNCYDLAFDHCDEDEHFSAIAVILSRIGYTKFDLGYSDEAQYYLLKSLQAYNKTIFAWGRADVYYCLALLSLRRAQREKAEKYIEGALLFSNKYDSGNLHDKIARFREQLVGNQPPP